MSERKINLNELFDESDIPFVLEGHKKTIVRLMKEACRQTLELAAENANTEYIKEYTGKIGYTVKVDKQSILDTINQIE